MKLTLKQKILKAIEKIDVAGTSKGYKDKIAKACTDISLAYCEEKNNELQKAHDFLSEQNGFVEHEIMLLKQRLEACIQRERRNKWIRKRKSGIQKNK